MYFNPRPPRGGRRQSAKTSAAGSGFQSTPPARGATLRNDTYFVVNREFQSTPPARGATFENLCAIQCTEISIHAPREGGDLACLRWQPLQGISIHAPREGGDDDSTALLPYSNSSFRISIHAPREGGDLLMILLYSIVDISIHAPREGGDYIKPNHP